jgi:DNA modification methylase
MTTLRIIEGNALSELRKLKTRSIHCVVTSPPYWDLRDYGMAGQLGSEATIDEYVAGIVEVFSEIKRVLRGDGTCWVNMGDTMTQGKLKLPEERDRSKGDLRWNSGPSKKRGGIRQKNVLMMPHRLAIALQDDGWYVRQDIVWHKTNSTPEPVRDRPTRAHEYIFLMSKNARYYYNPDPLRQPHSQASIERAQRNRVPTAWDLSEGGHRSKKGRYDNDGLFQGAGYGGEDPDRVCNPKGKNIRSVWDFPTKGYKGKHFATFPKELPRRCILAGCPPGGIVLDPFAGTGTTLEVALENGRSALGIELNPEYIKMIHARLRPANLSLVFD